MSGDCNSEILLPPCGPERDKLVAEALGCTTWWSPADFCSTTDAGAIAALEAWRKAKPGQYLIYSPSDDVGDTWLVEVWWEGAVPLWASAPTLGDAASQAIIAARKEGA